MVRGSDSHCNPHSQKGSFGESAGYTNHAAIVRSDSEERAYFGVVESRYVVVLLFLHCYLTCSVTFADPFATPIAAQHTLHPLPTTPHLFHQLQPIASSSSGAGAFLPRTSALYQRGIRFNTPNQTRLQQQPPISQLHHLPTYPSPFAPQYYTPQLGTPPASFHQPAPFPHPSFTGPSTPYTHPTYYHAQPPLFQPHTAIQRPPQPANAQPPE